ncbi:TYK2 isoform 5, partial [Pongo abelii]
MPLRHWGTARGSKPVGDGAQPMAAMGGLKVLLHWAGPGGGEPWVTFSESLLTAEEVCIHIAHKVVEMGFHHVSQDCLDLLMLWSAHFSLPKCWDYRREPLRPADRYHSSLFQSLRPLRCSGPSLVAPKPHPRDP